jgi:hypothetical protein
MLSSRLTRQFALVTGAVALVGMGALSACSTTKDKEKPAETPSQSTSAPASPSNAPAPTEKAVSPAGPSFSPTVKARPAPTALPGNVVTGG